MRGSGGRRWGLWAAGLLLAGGAVWWLVPGASNPFVGLFDPETPAWFTAAQAERGRKVSAQKCGGCHGRSLEGKLGPQLVGPRFMARWAGKDAGELEGFIRARMPLTRPGLLRPEEALALTAFILQGNGYPAGEAELGLERLRQIRLEPQTGPDASPPGY